MNNKEREVYDKYAYSEIDRYILLVYMEFERRVNGREIYEDLKKGECRFDYASWEKRLNITHKRMIRAIKILVKEECIQQRRKGKKGSASIYYLNRFLEEQKKEQSGEQKEEQKESSNSNNLRYIEEQDKEQNKEQNKVQSSKNNNQRIISKIVFDKDSKEMQLSKLLFSLMKSNNVGVKEPNFQNWSKEFNRILEGDNRELEDIKNVIRWCQNDRFWKSNILSPKKLREKYDALHLKMSDEDERNKIYDDKDINSDDIREKYYR